MANKRVVKNIRVARTRNSNTMTESQFWSMIRSALRQKSIFWKPIQECKIAAKRPYTGTNKRRKVEFACNHCNKGFTESEIVVDHIIPAGTLTCPGDLEGFIERLFCEVNGFQVLCLKCHHIKTQNEAKNRKGRKK